MHVRLLGTAAGGGVPQWNCNCLICREARAGTGRVKTRTQSCVAISADNAHWFLLNASPDLRFQIESFPPLHPPLDRVRGSPIQAVLLTNADLDHSLGLFQLREGERLRIHAPESVRRWLEDGLSFSATIEAFGGVQWIEPPSTPAPLLYRTGAESGLFYSKVPLSGAPPRFAKNPVSSADHVVGYRLTDPSTGGRLLFLPDVPAIDTNLQRLLRDCDLLLFDGTFWADDEMKQRGAGNLAASSMGHLPISGANGSLEILRSLSARHKIYVHINNTNPILLEDSPEQAAVRAAGCEIGHDGMEIIV